MAVTYVHFRGCSVSAEWDVVLRAAERAGVKFSLNSGHRTIKEQRVLFDKNMHKVNGVWVPKPGHPLTAVPTPTAPHIRIGRIDHALDIDPGSDAFVKFCDGHGLDVGRTVTGEHWHLEALHGQIALRRAAARLKSVAGPPQKHKVPAARYLMADVSSNNKDVNLSAYKAAGHRVIGLKATEGATFVDPTYQERVSRAHALGLFVVHYHFARPDNHPTPFPEVLAFTNVVAKNFKRGDRIALDHETNMGNVSVNLDKWGQEFLSTATKILNTNHPWLYSYTSFMREHGVRAPKGSRLWLSDFSAPILGTRPGLQAPWVHQFTNGALGPEPHTIAGIGHCDISKLSRRALLGLHIH